MYSISPAVGGIPADIPADLYVAGCPPHPLTLLDLQRLLGRMGPQTQAR